MVGTGWLPNNYDTYHEISVSNGSGGDLTNYQIQVIVNRGAPGGVPDAGVYYVDEGDLRSDFADIRFTDSSYNSLPYWLEYISSVRYRIWVKVPSIPTAGCTIYMFTGNPNENRSESNGDKTFEFFDDFLGSALDSKWSYANAPTVSVSNSVMSFQGKNAYVQVYSATTFGTNYAMRAKAKMDSASDGQSIGFESIAAANCAAWVRKSNGTWDLRTGISSTYTDTAITTDTNWHTVEIRRNASTSVTLNIDGTSVTSTTNLPTTALATPDFNNWATGTYVYCDWVLVRKYTATEPTVSVAGHGGRSQILPHIIIQKNDWQYTEE